jgi:hypothetical protein
MKKFAGLFSVRIHDKVHISREQLFSSFLPWFSEKNVKFVKSLIYNSGVPIKLIYETHVLFLHMSDTLDIKVDQTFNR